MAKLFSAIQDNPIIMQARRTRRQPSSWVMLLILLGLWGMSFGIRQWRSVGYRFNELTFFILWLLPPSILIVATLSTARWAKTDTFQTIRSSTLGCRQVVWGYGLTILYRMRLILVLFFGLAPIGFTDGIVGGVATILCIAGLCILAAILGTVSVLRWGRERLALLLIMFGCILVTLILTSDLPAGCLPIARLGLNAILLRVGMPGILPLMVAVIIPLLLALILGRLSWRKSLSLRRLQAEIGLGLLLLISLLGTGVLVIDHSDRWALTALYAATGGSDWRSDKLWRTSEPVCDWEGVTCDCGHVIRLSLIANNLQGDLPSAISGLTELRSLDLSRNQLTSFPSTISTLSQLRDLTLPRNQITVVPSQIGQLARLENLHLEYNQIAVIPPEIGRLDNLKNLYLNNNQLQTLPPEIGQMQGLRSLYLDQNQLTALPPEIGELSSLQNLHLYYNELSTIPVEIGQLHRLRTLHLHNNQLLELPPEIGMLTNLDSLLLYNNQLTTIPPEIGQLHRLRTLYLQDNPLERLPLAVCKLNALTYAASSLCDD